MAIYAVLLRSVNVGGKNRVPMAEFRDGLEAAGHLDVRTYVQSGNAVLRSPDTPAAVAASVRRQLKSQFGLDIAVIVRTAKELAKVEGANPFLERATDPGKQLHVAFLEAAPDRKGVADLDPLRAAPEELHVDGRHIYLWCPNGIGRSKVFVGVERRLKTAATVRNWRTVVELARLTA